MKLTEYPDFMSHENRYFAIPVTVADAHDVELTAWKDAHHDLLLCILDMIEESKATDAVVEAAEEYVEADTAHTNVINNLPPREIVAKASERRVDASDILVSAVAALKQVQEEGNDEASRDSV